MTARGWNKGAAWLPYFYQRPAKISPVRLLRHIACLSPAVHFYRCRAPATLWWEISRGSNVNEGGSKSTVHAIGDFACAGRRLRISAFRSTLWLSKSNAAIPTKLPHERGTRYQRDGCLIPRMKVRSSNHYHARRRIKPFCGCGF